MDREDEKKFTLIEYNWHIVNNLREFDSKPELIQDMYTKMVQYLPDHPMLAQFYDIYKTALTYYENHSEFPDIKWFEVNYTKSRTLKRTNNDFSIQVFEDCVKLVDAEIIKKSCANVVNTVNPDISQLRALVSQLSSYCDNAASIPVLTKTDIINLLDEYSKEYSGVYTGIEQLDEQIGVLGHKSISVFGAPSGHGKSTFAVSVAYNAAVRQGLCVDYVSYEVPKDHIWFNLVSLHSSVVGAPLESSKLKENTTTEEEKKTYREVASDLLNEIKKSGGYINVIDQTTAAVDTFEGLCARLEGIATERVDGEKKFDRKADLIVIDNVDNLQILKSKERDEQTKVNNYIVKLDAYCKQYHHGDGCAILILTQLNRGGLAKLQRAEKDPDPKNRASMIDVTVFQKYNALYEKATCCLVGYADAALRFSERINIYPVKLRNRAVPEEPLIISAKYKYSRIGGEFTGNDGYAFDATPPMEDVLEYAGEEFMDEFGEDDNDYSTEDLE